MKFELDWLKKWSLYYSSSPSKVALSDGDSGRSFTYADLYKYANRGARLLQERYGIFRGDRVAIFSTNEVEYVFLFFALQRLGAIMVPINFRLTDKEVEHIVRDSDPKLLLTQDSFTATLEKLAYKPAHMALLTGANSFASWLEQIDKDEEVRFAGEAEDPVMILYTSGTTGSPKGAIITHQVLFWNSINTSMRLNISQSDCTLIFLPFFHTGGWNVLTTPFFHRGAHIVLLKKFDADRVLQVSEQEKATILFGVPTTMEMMARTETFKEVSLKSLRYAIVGGEPMPVPLIKAWAAKGIPIRQGYGLTEFGPNVFSLNEEDAIRKIGSIGFANFYIETRIVNDDNQDVGPDEVGELILKGPMCMAGYWKNEKATRETIIDGWLHTGDLVRKDAEGYFYVVGRKKDMYISGGENVYPAEVEKVIYSLPGIREVAVIGVPDEKWGEVGKAFVVIGDNQMLNADGIQNYCQRHLAKFKIPKYFEFCESLPKGDSGKILKRALRS